MFSRFDRIPACEGQTDGQTDTLRQHMSALCIASRGKNSNRIQNHLVFTEFIAEGATQFSDVTSIPNRI